MHRNLETSARECDHCKEPWEQETKLARLEDEESCGAGKGKRLAFGPVRGGGEVSLNELLAEFPGQLLSAGAIGSRSAFALPVRDHCSKRGGKQITRETAKKQSIGTITEPNIEQCI